MDLQKKYLIKNQGESICTSFMYNCKCNRSNVEKLETNDLQCYFNTPVLNLMMVDLVRFIKNLKKENSCCP